jgi:replicative DNA helicase
VAKRSVAAEERTLPHNLEAERSVLGAILVHNGAWAYAAEKLRAADFYRDAHAHIWTAMTALIDRKVAIDFTTLREELTRVGDIDDVGGPSYVSSLSDGVPRATNVTYYAGIVREKAILREVIYAANKVLVTAYEAEDKPEDVLRQADRAFLELQRRKGASRLRPLKDTVGGIFARMEWREANQGKLVGVDTGFPQINELTLGWRKKDMIIVAARPSIGKTVFAMNAAVAAARAGHKVAVFSYEMRREQLEDRILSSLTQIPFYRIELGAFGAADHPKISDAIGVISNLPIAIDDRAGQYVSDIRNSCRRLQNEDGLDLVVIDYVQLIPSELARRGASKNEQVTEISRSVKELADELDVPIMLLSQLKRLDPRRPDPRPQLDDLRESGSLEQDADEVNFLHRKNHKESGTTNYIREKARNGPTGTRNLTIDRDTVTFTDGGEDIPEEPPKRRKKKGEKDPDPQAELPADDAGS